MANDPKGIEGACPWHGTNDELSVEDNGVGCFWVICNKTGCGCEGPYAHSEADAIAAWNNRAASTPAKPVGELVEQTNALRDFPKNTCGASRHVQMIGEALIKGEQYAMLAEEPGYVGESLLSVVGALYEARTALTASQAQVATLTAALEWYGENVSLCRKISSDGDVGRDALATDGGKRARAALNPKPSEPT